MTRAETAPPMMERQAHSRFNRLPHSIETDKKSWVVFTVNADVVNVASTSLGGESPTLRQLAEPNMVYAGNTYARTIPTSGLVEIPPDLHNSPAGTLLNYGSVGTMPNIYGAYSGMFRTSGFVETTPDLHNSPAGTLFNYGSVGTMPSIYGTYSGMFPISGFAEMTPDPQAAIFPNTWSDQIIQNAAEQLPAAVQPTQGISEHTKRDDEMANMISSSQSMLTVASSVFEAMRPLTDKERRYLGKFYNRAFKTR
jgi:hypothetical protein